MAGIGFSLRKLSAQDNLSGILRAYCYSLVAAVGPWLLVVLSLSSIIYFTSRFLEFSDIDDFAAIIVYNFGFSFILTGGLYLVSARYVADSLYLRSFYPIPGIFIFSQVLLLVPAILISAIFYIFFATMSPLEIVLSIINFTLLAETWIIMLYLAVIRDFRAITLSWGLGALLTIFLAVFLGRTYGTVGMLTGFNIGVTFIVYSMKAQILAEYPFRYRHPTEFRFYFRHYSGLFWSGLFLYGGLWLDKVIMWGAPEAITHLNGLRTYPVHDGAMFYSFLSIVPVMALFVFSLETNFYDNYTRFVQHIERNSPLAFIKEEQKNIIHSLLENGRTFLILQGTVSLALIASAPALFDWLGIDFLELLIFRLGVVGAFFAALNLFIVVIFSYFDSQNNMLKVTSMLIVSNIVLTLITRWMGFPFYGLGYCLAMILSFGVAAILLMRFLDKLPYHIFITNVVKRVAVAKHYAANDHRVELED